MNQLECLSKLSNAVLSPNDTSITPIPKSRRVETLQITAEEIAWRKAWCKQQLKNIGEFGAVLQGGIK